MIEGYEVITKDVDIEKINKNEYEEITINDFLNRISKNEKEKNEYFKTIFSINIHIMISEESYDMAMETLHDKLIDARLNKLNAIVMLSLKKKGRGINFTTLSLDKFKILCDYALDNNIGIGFDSCGANKFIKVIERRPDKEKILPMVEPCESSLFSSYVSVDAKFYPCSFAEGTEGWKEGLDVLNCNNFTSDIWNNEKTLSFRKKLLDCKRNCPIFEV